MGWYQNPIGPPDPYEGYRVEPIEKSGYKKGGNQGPPEEPPEKKWGVISYLLNAIQKSLNFILQNLKKNHLAQSAPLLEFKSALELLQKEDRSEDIAYLNHLALIWSRLLEENSIQRQASLETFLKKIQHYPENQPHTFGYYLTEYAGQRWIPFPYMEMIRKIHTDYKKFAESSALAEWVQDIDRLLRDQ